MVHVAFVAIGYVILVKATQGNIKEFYECTLGTIECNVYVYVIEFQP